jgi:hypothetical protein
MGIDLISRNLEISLIQPGKGVLGAIFVSCGRTYGKQSIFVKGTQSAMDLVFVSAIHANGKPLGYKRGYAGELRQGAGFAAYFS